MITYNISSQFLYNTHTVKKSFTSESLTYHNNYYNWKIYRKANLLDVGNPQLIPEPMLFIVFKAWNVHLVVSYTFVINICFFFFSSQCAWINLKRWLFHMLLSIIPITADDVSTQSEINTFKYLISLTGCLYNNISGLGQTVKKYNNVICQIITKLQLQYFLTLKTIISGDVSLIINSNQLMCCIMWCGGVGWCCWCAAWWSIHILSNEKTLRRNF